MTPGHGDRDLDRRRGARGRHRRRAGRADRAQRATAVRVPATEPGANIRRAGEDIAAGEVVLRAGDDARARRASGVAASVGRAALSCARRPRVALLVTGDELTEPGRAARAGRHLQLQRLRARRAGRARRRDARRRASACPTAPRPPARRSAPRSTRRTSSWSPAACRSARTTTSRARWPSSGRERALLGREPAARASRPGSAPRGDDARLRPARQPGVGDGHLPAVRAAGAGGAPGRRPVDHPHHRAARASRSRATRAASRPCACG